MQDFGSFPGVRTRSFFGFDWQFALTDSQEYPENDVAWRPVQLPHDWSVDFAVKEDAPSSGSGGYACTGIGWYRRSFVLECSESEKISLLFDGVYMNCDIWLNGMHVGGHIYGYTSFELDVTQALHSGSNEVLVRVNNSHQPGSRWYSGSGITRNVWLLRTNVTHTHTWGIFIATDRISREQADAQICMDATCAPDADQLMLEIEILDPNGCICARKKADIIAGPKITCRHSLVIPSPELWDIDAPKLYTACIRIFSEGKLLDEMEIPFGIRTIAFDNKNGFLLNGRKVILRGVCLHHDGGCVGAAVPPEIWHRRLMKLKAMGCNALRCSHNPPDPALLDLADMLGFVVMDEAFDEWQLMKGKEFGSNTHSSRGYSDWFDACWKDDVTSMVLRDRNHPSIIMWSIGNEVREQVTEDGWKVARQLAGLVHALDPTRPITQACDQVKAEPVAAYTTFLEELDLVGVNYTDRWRERTETFFDEEKQEHPDWIMLGTEDVSVGGVRGDFRLQTEESVWGRTEYYARMLKAEKLWKYIRTHPYVIGSFMWTGTDYLGECFWPAKNSTAGVMDTCAFEKDGYYFYQSVWTKDQPVLYVCPHLDLDVEPGTVVPVIAYTNCFTVELLVDGRSWGVKAYEFPAQGMTAYWPHFEQKQAPITTNDLHLTWDIPWTHGEIVAIGRDAEGRELVRQVLHPSGRPAKLNVQVDCNELPADGRSVVQLELTLQDAQGRRVYNRDVPVTIQVTGGSLLGMDNGKPDDHTLYASGERDTFGGRAYAVIRAAREDTDLMITLSAPGLDNTLIRIPYCSKG